MNHLATAVSTLFTFSLASCEAPSDNDLPPSTGDRPAPETSTASSQHVGFWVPQLNSLLSMQGVNQDDGRMTAAMKKQFVADHYGLLLLVIEDRKITMHGPERTRAATYKLDSTGADSDIRIRIDDPDLGAFPVTIIVRAPDRMTLTMRSPQGVLDDLGSLDSVPFERIDETEFRRISAKIEAARKHAVPEMIDAKPPDLQESRPLRPR